MTRLDDFLGLLMFVVFLVISMGSKAANDARRKRRAEEDGEVPAPRAPQWPGPVAGPGLPGFPQPERPLPPASRPPIAMEGEGVGMEGVGSEGAGTEGPAPGDTAEAEIVRFDRQTAEMSRGAFMVGQEADAIAASDPGPRQLGMLTEQPDSDYAALQEEETGPNLAEALATPASVGQALILSEVLGKPVALRPVKRFGVR